MSPITSAARSAKVELMTATHNFAASVTQSCAEHTNTVLDSIASTAGICVGAVVSGPGIPAGTVVSRITSNVALQTDVATTATATNTLTFTHDVFKICLIKSGATGAYDKTLVNYGTGSGAPTTVNIGTDEQAASGTYAAGGLALTNVSPALSTDTGTTSFSPDPTWTGATLSVIAAVIYNTNKRQGSASAGLIANRSFAILDLNGVQGVVNGTLTLTMPTPDATSALIRVG